MAIERDLWIDVIEENLFQDNSFAKFAIQTPQESMKGRYVHIPQAGNIPGIVLDRSIFPAIVERRVDSDIVFRMQSISSNPVQISNQELQFETKDKIRSVLADHVGTLSDRVHTNLIFSWVSALLANASAGNAGSATAAASVIRTTGANILPHAGGGTGTRKAFTYADLKKAKVKLDNQNIPAEGRYAIMDTEMESQLMADPALQGFKNSVSVNNGSGTLQGQVIAGFTILIRVTVVTYDNSATPVAKAIGGANAITDNAAVVCWQKDCVQTAVGTIDFFAGEKDPLYYGNLYSTEIFTGGTKRRKNGDGIVCIVQIP